MWKINFLPFKPFLLLCLRLCQLQLYLLSLPNVSHFFLLLSRLPLLLQFQLLLSLCRFCLRYFLYFPCFSIQKYFQPSLVAKTLKWFRFQTYLSSMQAHWRIKSHTKIGFWRCRTNCKLINPTCQPNSSKSHICRAT